MKYYAILLIILSGVTTTVYDEHNIFRRVNLECGGSVFVALYCVIHRFSLAPKKPIRKYNLLLVGLITNKKYFDKL